MSWFFHDPDEWTVKVEHTNYGKDPLGNPIGATSFRHVRRPPEEVAAIKSREKREREDAILAEAEAIKVRRRDNP